MPNAAHSSGANRCRRPGEAQSDLWQVVEFSKRFKTEDAWPKEFFDKNARIPR